MAQLTRSSDVNENSLTMTDVPTKLFLYPDDSYEGPTVPEFDGSRGEGIVAFVKAVGVVAPPAKEHPQARPRGDLWATWQTAVSSSDGRQPEDFGFLFKSNGHRNGAIPEGSGGCRSRSRSPSRSRDGEDWKVDKQIVKVDASISEGRASKKQRLNSNTSRPVGNCSRGKAGTTLICKFWLRGACVREDCKFLHCETDPKSEQPNCEDGTQRRSPSQSSGNGPCQDSTPVSEFRLEGIEEDEEGVEAVQQPPRNKAVMCKFALRGCPRGNCSFAHSEEERRDACKNMLCQFDSRGRCRQGAKCWYRHTNTAPNTPQPSPVNGAQESPGNHPEPSPLKSLDAGRLRARTFEDDASSAASACGQQDKTLLCKFWLQKKCQRVTNCKFAHGEEEQRAACARVRCRFFETTGRCRQADECWFLHDLPMDTEPPVPLAPTVRERWADLEDSNSVHGSAHDNSQSRPQPERWADLEDSNSVGRSQ